MHDPLTVAFEIPRPWPRTAGRFRYWPALVVVWHVDPEADGSDDSCDWFNRRKRRFRIHPRWHVWHWRIRVPVILQLKRWAWSRCCRCGGRFRWGYEPVTDSWSAPGPGWFKGEPSTYHHDCKRPESNGAAEARP